MTKCANTANSFDVGKSTWPTGSFPAGASWCGAQDMAGNVWQWCGDRIGDYSLTATTNPTGPETGDYHTLRGGSWNHGYDYCDRSAARFSGYGPVEYDFDIGFRCASPSPFPIAPTITTITPPSAVVGTVITITGTDLDKVTAVTFNGIAAKTITDNTATSLKVTVPEGATSGKLVVTAPGGTITSVDDFIILFGLKTNAKDNATMLWVPGGTFTMGNAADVRRYAHLDDDEHPAHQVTLNGYWIYKYDVTVAQYRVFCTHTKRKLPEWPGDQLSWEGKTSWDDPALQQHPIINVSWDDAKAYAEWAGVTLPTEAQWEYAARGMLGNIFPWGNASVNESVKDWSGNRCANMQNSYFQGKSTWPVGSFPAGASWCGALDMAGNVWQWCGNWYDLYAAAAVTNPTGPATGINRVARGGSWSIEYCVIGYNYGYRSTLRYIRNPDNRDDTIGFRCAVIAPGP